MIHNIISTCKTTNINTKRNSVKENIKKENDYLNNNSEDEYENRPIVVGGLGSYTNNNNNNNNNNSISNDNKNAIASQNLINADTLEEVRIIQLNKILFTFFL